MIIIQLIITQIMEEVEEVVIYQLFQMQIQDLL